MRGHPAAKHCGSLPTGNQRYQRQQKNCLASGLISARLPIAAPHDLHEIPPHRGHGLLGLADLACGLGQGLEAVRAGWHPWSPPPPGAQDPPPEP